jgi:arginyl-tRNA synthetase
LLSREQTDRAITNLAKNQYHHIPNGYLLLTDGAMSSRKGKVIHFDTLIERLESSAKTSLIEKNYSEFSEEKITTLAIAALKWADLNRDREQDIVFDVEQVTKFEGNTGVYQLYTYARLNNIVAKSSYSEDQILQLQEVNISSLNTDEIALLELTLRLPIVLENVCQSYKPHHLASYIFELTSAINSWYGKNNVINETDQDRQKALLVLTLKLKNHLKVCLELLGMTTLEEM